MAQDLPFSVANILRPDFPSPSRISPTPRMLYIEHLRENKEQRLKKSLQPLQCVNGGLFSVEVQENGTFLNCGCIRQKEVDGNYLLEKPREGKTVF